MVAQTRHQQARNRQGVDDAVVLSIGCKPFRNVEVCAATKVGPKHAQIEFDVMACYSHGVAYIGEKACECLRGFD